MVKRSYSKWQITKMVFTWSSKMEWVPKKYKIELIDKLDSLDQIKSIEKEQEIVTLLYAAKDETLTHTIILQKILGEINTK